MITITTENLNYKELGLACGLELHQQLNTNKLFCKCPSKLISDNTKPSKIIKRKLRAVASEAGELDLTARLEQKKDKTFIYQVYDSCNCLVETDSQPPFPINQEALKIATVISKLTNSTLVDKGYIMRKQVINGSNVSGFQRTVMVSTDGYLDFDFGRVRIDKILLEEDAARAIEKKDNEVTYSLDRLGIPLIELVAWHDIHTPEDVEKTALFLGQLFRCTGKTKRGLGSIRQDINISIKEGARTEIKGAQDIHLIPEIVKREVVRQLNLLQVKKELIKRKIKEIKLNENEITNIFQKTESKVISTALKLKKQVFGFKLDNFKGILGFEVQPDKRIGSELASILKATTSLRGIFHSDELPNYGITNNNISEINKLLDIKENDAFFLCVCKKEEILLVKELLEGRLNQLLVGVPEETRMVNPDGNTEFMRPLSGTARMYPETDLLPIEFSKEFLEEVNKEIPLTIEEREKLYINKFKISKQLVNKMKLNNFAPIFEKIVKETKVNATTLAVFLLEDLTKASRDSKIDLDDVIESKLVAFFSSNLGKVPKQKVLDLFIYYLNNSTSVEQAIKDLKLDLASDIDLKKIIDEIIQENKDKVIELKERAQGLLMGRVMAKTKGLADGKEVAKQLAFSLKEFLK